MREPLEKTDDSGGGQADATDSIESLLESEADTETVVEKLGESGPRYHVSESNVDDILDSAAPAADGPDSNSLAPGGDPTRTVSSAGIDDVFEELEADAAPRDDEPIAVSETTDRRADEPESSPFARAAEDPDFEELKREYGSLSGREPEKTISDEGVDEILALAADDPDDATARSAEAPDEDPIRPDDSAAAMSSLFDDGVASDGAESTDELTWN